MGRLWRRKVFFRRYNPDSEKDRREFHSSPLAFLLYQRLYKNLSQEELLELIRGTQQSHWPVLDLRLCGLVSLPEELGDLPDLRGLMLGNHMYRDEDYSSFGDFNPFTALPDFIGNLFNLQSLNLSKAHIAALPDSIGNLSNLQSLDLSDTSITALPDSIGNLSNLQSLDLSDTSITALPDSIGNLSNLRSLNFLRVKSSHNEEIAQGAEIWYSIGVKAIERNQPRLSYRTECIS